MGRDITLVLMGADGSLLGALPSFPVEVPYWQEVADVLDQAADRYALRPDVLRLLTAERPHPHGGAVTYLAQASPPIGVALEPVPEDVAALATQDEPLRTDYARPGGPRRSVTWALDVLGPVTAHQQRTWNLSTIWRFGETPVAWLKQVPTFFAHEGAVLSWLADAVPGHVPTVIAVGEEHRMLLEHVPGEDLYEADLGQRDRIVEVAHAAQLAGIDATEHLVTAGVPDRRGRRMAEWLRDALAGWIDGHPAQALLDGVEERLDAVADCGLPDTLVHGDSHPGNAIGDGERIVLIDWGDSFVGCPAFDALRLGVGLPRQSADDLIAAWARRWQASVPGCSPLRAAQLLRPVEGLFLAAVYARFVANIEPTERRYHEADITIGLDAAAEESTT